MGCSESSLASPLVAPQCSGGEAELQAGYRVGANLGQGSFAQVHAALECVSPGPHANTHGHARAVKIVDLKSAPSGKKSRQKEKDAVAETAIWKHIGQHPNCVTFYEFFLGNGLCYMVMERCESSLRESLKATRDLNERSIGSVFSQMLSGILHLHSLRIVHRDIKPDNVCVGGNDGETVKLIDFGFAAMLPAHGWLRGPVGTFPYICPEMLNGQRYGEKADIWSFAVVVYVLLFGEFPYMPPKSQLIDADLVERADSLKQAIAGQPPPKFEPSASSGKHHAAMRSESVIEFAKALLCQCPEQRPSAEESLSMTYMRRSMDGSHMRGVKKLPSLHLSLYSAEKAGAFYVRHHTPKNEIGMSFGQMSSAGRQVEQPDEKLMSNVATDESAYSVGQCVSSKDDTSDLSTAYNSTDMDANSSDQWPKLGAFSL